MVKCDGCGREVECEPHLVKEDLKTGIKIVHCNVCELLSMNLNLEMFGGIRRYGY